MSQDKSNLYKITIRPLNTPEEREQAVKDVVEAIRKHGENAKRDTNRRRN